MTRGCRLVMATPITVVLLAVVLVDLARAQLNLPEMPGPPYPDRYGNNRWGVKYDPRLHGRGSRPPSHHQTSSASSSSSPWGGPPQQEYHQPQERPPRYRGGGGGPPPGHSSTRNKWAPGLKPLVSSTISKFKAHARKRRPYNGGSDASSSYGGFDPTSDSFYNDPYTSKSIDRYVKNYLKHYDAVSQAPTSASDLANIENFAGPMDLSGKFRPRNFAMNGNRPNHYNNGDRTSASSSNDNYVRTTRYSSPSSSSNNQQPLYRTYNPQSNSYSGQQSDGTSSISRISTSTKTFAKTLSNIYNDYKPGAENANYATGSSSVISNSPLATAASDAIINSVIVAEDPYSLSPSYSSSPPRSPPSRPRPHAVRTSSNYAGAPSSSYSKRPRPSSSVSRPLSALDMYQDTRGGYSSPGGGPVSTGYTSGYSSGGGYYSGIPGGNLAPPISSSGYSPGSSPPGYSSYDSYGLEPGPYSSVADSPVSIPSSSPVGLNSISPSSDYYYSSPSYSPYKTKRTKNRLQHTPMNVLRGLFGRGDRDYKRSPANLPYHQGPPQQYSYNPLLNSLTQGLDFLGGHREPSVRRPPVASSPFSFGFENRPPAGSGSRLPGPTGVGADSSDDATNQKDPQDGPTFNTNWPKIFTAMGSSVDAIAGGIHAVRKEVSKMTGQAVAKGLMMGGSAVNEVSKGMATVITKMAHI